MDTWRSTYAGIVPADYLAGLSYERSEQLFRRGMASGSCLYVAETPKGEIAGFVSGGPPRQGLPGYRGELYAIYIRDAYHGQGIGRRPAPGAGLRLGGRGRTRAPLLSASG